ncbi:hypothetical protein M3G91_09595, partial [Micromonospora chalcea]|uniref:hypothetical protein n=1 Tax=Micromonospora chalcea TaxID=1874 RepID=UPI0021A27E4D
MQAAQRDQRCRGVIGAGGGLVGGAAGERRGFGPAGRALVRRGLQQLPMRCAITLGGVIELLGLGRLGVESLP